MQLLSQGNRWRGFLTCLAGMFSVAIGQGAYLVLIVSYLERIHTPVAVTGTLMACLSIAEAAMSLGCGFILRMDSLWTSIVLPLAFQAISALILVFQPLGLPIWVSALINGAGMGIVGVGLYAAVLDRRPASVSLGSTIGWYTALIAAGNGLGSLLGGTITDRYGFGAAFGLSVGGFGLATALMLTLASSAQSRPDPVTAVDPEAHRQERQDTPAWVWALAVIAGFTMSSVTSAFDTLFPVYGLRAGLTLTVIGSLSGLKAFLAAIIRPFSGVILQRVNVLRTNTASLLSLAATTMLMPWAGTGAGLTAAIGAMGLAFGVIRVVSATLSLHGQPSPAVANRRIGLYNSALCFGAIAGPWVGGLLGAWLGLPMAIAVVPGVLVPLFLIAMLVLPRLAVFGKDHGRTESPA